MLKDIRSLSYDELSNDILDLGFPKFRVNQIFSWVHEKCVSSFDEMTNISKDMRAKLSEYFTFNNCKINTKLVSNIDDTVKYLFEFPDGEYVESVLSSFNELIKLDFTVGFISHVDKMQDYINNRIIVTKPNNEVGTQIRQYF